MYYPLICLPLTTMIVCPGRMVDKGLLSGIPLVSSRKDAFTPFKRSFFRNIANFLKEKLMEILQIWLKSSQIWTFPRIFSSRNRLYFGNYFK